jgi:1-acyl-sn-glycerol-3-phosphate acyltransferase
MQTATETPGLILSLARWTACVGTSAPFIAHALARTAFEAERAKGSKLLDTWATVQRRIFGIELNVEDANRGHYPEPPYIFVVLNQTSHVESFILMTAMPLPTFFVMNLRYAIVPNAWPLWRANGVVIVREWPNHARHRMEKVKRLLREGKNLGISIEGRRSTDGRLSPFKKGPVVLALETGATIVPMILHGARDRLPYGEWRVRPGTVNVTLGRTIPTRGLTYADRDDIVGRLKAFAEGELSAHPASPSPG